jgi:methyl-galactoside transport system substrate-binding protein
MKKSLIVLLLLVLTMTMSACEDSYDKIPLILYNEIDPYILEFKGHILNEAEGKLEIESYDSQNSQLLQNEIIENVLEKNPRILIINPVDRLGAYSIIDKVKQQDIPIIFINREPLEADMDSWNKLYYIGAPAENSAAIQSEMIIDLFGDPEDLSDLDINGDGIIQLVIFKGEQGHQDAEIRTEVVIKELEDYGYRLEILAIEVCDWQRIIAYNKMNQLLTSLESEIELVISNNDAMAIGAIDAMIENDLFIDINEDGVITPGTDTWIPVVGIDGIEDAFEYIENGYLYGTVINDSKTMSEVLIELAEALINGTNLDDLSFEIIDGKYIWIDYQKYEKEED